MITTIFKVFSTFSAVFIISGSARPYIIKIQIFLTYLMKYSACIVILAQTLFITFFGLSGNSKLDEQLKKMLPWLYENLNFVGLTITNEKHDLKQEEIKTLEAKNLNFYVLYLLFTELVVILYVKFEGFPCVHHFFNPIVCALGLEYFGSQCSECKASSLLCYDMVMSFGFALGADLACVLISVDWLESRNLL